MQNLQNNPFIYAEDAKYLADNHKKISKINGLINSLANKGQYYCVVEIDYYIQSMLEEKRF